MKKIIVHLGVHKTATTSLQIFFSRSRNQLASQGIAFFPLSEMRKTITPLICSNRQADMNKLRDLVNSNTQQTVIFSDENILGDASEILRNNLYQFSFSRVQNMCEVFHDSQLEFILVVRDPVDFIVSMYCEHLRHSPYIEFEDYTRNMRLEDFSFARTFAWIDSLSAAVKVRVLGFGGQHKLGPLEVSHALLDSAATDPSLLDYALMPKNKSRSSFSREEIELFRYISVTAGPRMVKHYIGTAEANQGRFGTTKFAPIPQSVSVRMREKYAEDLRWLTTR